MPQPVTELVGIRQFPPQLAVAASSSGSRVVKPSLPVYFVKVVPSPY